ncbi:MAG TPA: tRNA (guanosine(37)-N1)-methyltransferase TrmD [Candidatus Binatia bacterium]|jgi:tRNA (guanine37-N1)-methyltransferase|nr:tRNA (guanosine(37)-N1)-methyltransferase TrmD [Candidatus Binatia bacterium]
MRFDVLTIFPPMFDGYFTESIIKRARERGLLDVRVHDLRGWTTDKHHKVDDKPYGGGPGMVMKVEPFDRALKELKAQSSKLEASRTRVVLMSAKGKRFTHKDAVRLSKYKRLVLLCGRYEGVDERVAANLADEELSIGDYVLTGGELPAMVVIDAVSRHVPGVLGKKASLAEESHSEEGVTEYPQYTRPEVYAPKKGVSWKVPKVLLSGAHDAVAAWREKKRRKKG